MNILIMFSLRLCVFLFQYLTCYLCATLASTREPIQRRQYEGHTMSSSHRGDQGPLGHHQYDDSGVYCGLSTASEVLHFSLPTIYIISALEIAAMYHK